MSNSDLSVQENRALGTAANAGARAAVVADSTLDARRLADDLATSKHGVSLSVVEKRCIEAAEKHSLALAALNARRTALAEASLRFAGGTSSSGNSAVMTLGHMVDHVASLSKWTQAALGYPAPCLRIRVRWGHARKARLADKRDEVSASVQTYATQMESTFDDFKKRAKALRRKP